MDTGYIKLFEKEAKPVKNEIFPIISREHLNMVMEHLFNINSDEKNELTKYNLYIDGKTLKLYADADRIRQYQNLKAKLKDVNPRNIMQEIFYVKFDKKEATGNDLCDLVKRFKELIKESEEKKEIPVAKWDYFVFHCNEWEEAFHLHRIFEY